MILWVLFGLPLLYLWLTGWWFAGVIVALGLRILGQPTSEAWIEAAAIGFAPWLVRKVLRAIMAAESERRLAAARERSRGHLLTLPVISDRDPSW